MIIEPIKYGIAFALMGPIKNKTGKSNILPINVKPLVNAILCFVFFRKTFQETWATAPEIINAKRKLLKFYELKIGSY